MDRKLTLTELDDRPELSIEIGGSVYHFSEVPLEKLADVQEFLNRTVPHPLQAIRPHLAGLSESDRAVLLRDAREEGKHWPPQAGTAAGMAALMATEPGQVEALFAGLSVHHPALDRRAAERVYRQLRREAGRAAVRARRLGLKDDGEGAVSRIFSVIFGMGDPAVRDDDDNDRPALPEG